MHLVVNLNLEKEHPHSCGHSVGIGDIFVKAKVYFQIPPKPVILVVTDLYRPRDVCVCNSVCRHIRVA